MSEQAVSAALVNKAGAAKVLGIADSAIAKLPDFPPADEYMEGGGTTVTPLWWRSTVEAYGQSAAYLARKRFTPKSLRK